MVRKCAIFALLRLNRLEQFRDFRRNSLQRRSVESDPAVSLRRFRDGFKAGLFFKKRYTAMSMLLRAKHKILAKTYVVKKDEFSFMLNKCTEVGASDFACCSVSRRSTERGVLDCLL